MTDEQVRALFQRTCSKCGEESDVQERYSYGVYAGRLCTECCYSYSDNCGLDNEQHDLSDLDEYPDHY